MLRHRWLRRANVRRRSRDAACGGDGLTLVFLCRSQPCWLSLVPEPRVPPQPYLTLMQNAADVGENRSRRNACSLPDFLLGIAQGRFRRPLPLLPVRALALSAGPKRCFAIYFVAGLLGVPIWWFAARLGHRACKAHFIYTPLTTAILFVLPRVNLWLVAPFMIVAGLSQGGGVLLTRALMADVVDEDELTTGSRRSAPSSACC